MYPPDQITAMLQLTNSALQVHSKREMTRGELIRFFGAMILETRFRFNNRHDLWRSSPRNPCIPPARFGEKTGLSRNRCNDIWRHLRWSYQPKQKPEEMSWEKYRWMLVDGHVTRFKEHRENSFYPSDLCQ
jgi:Transposase IS4